MDSSQANNTRDLQGTGIHLSVSMFGGVREGESLMRITVKSDDSDLGKESAGE